jgi:hypothetical protein
VAALTRRSFSDLRDEVLKRSGRPGDSAASSRVEYWVDAVYRDLCLTYHHFELDTIAADQALAAAASSVSLPADLYALIGVALKTSAGVEIHRLTPERASYLLGRRETTADEPKEYARFGSKLYFPAPADAAYLLDIYYYKEPVAPDFSSGAPAWNRMWDEFLVAGATDFTLRGFWSENAIPHAETLKSFLSRVVNPPLASGVLRDDENRPTIDRPHGGAQG